MVRAAGEAEAWLAVALDDDAAWPALSRTIGRDDLGADPALAGLAGRKAREDELEAAVAAWARTLAPAAAAGARLTHYRIDETHSNAFAVWKKMGAPPGPNAAQYKQLLAAGQLAQMDAPAPLAVANGAAALKLWSKSASA